MQSDLTSMLHQKSRLAALGLAVSKINHDLRNMLASAQLVLGRAVEPCAIRACSASRRSCMRALERAIEFCQSTLSYGRAQEAAAGAQADRARGRWSRRCARTLGLAEADRSAGSFRSSAASTVDADHDQLLRVLLNLARNAVQALEARAPNDPLRDQIRITGRREGARGGDRGVRHRPRLPAAQGREHLFEAFQGSTRTGGTGLGLAIAAELIRAHGGEIALVEGTIGATFRLTIPDRAVELDARREDARAPDGPEQPAPGSRPSELVAPLDPCQSGGGPYSYAAFRAAWCGSAVCSGMRARSSAG